MTTNHTPGPWHADRAGSELAIYADVQSDGPAKVSMILAKTFYNRGASVFVDRTNREQVANARLIAAAPDLLAALEAVLPILERLSPTAQAFLLERKQARAAIAKAKGE